MKLYRYVDNPCCGWLESSKADLILYTVKKETPQGYWIYTLPDPMPEYGYDQVRWISKTARNKFACLTLQDAANNYLKRKEKQLKILESKLRSTKQYLIAAKELIKELAE